MSASGNIFLSQHQGLMQIGAEIIQAINGPVDDEAVRKVRKLAARFKGALLVHQRMENDALYPRLLAHPDPSVAEEARSLFEELGDIYDAFMAFEARWGSSEAVAEDTSGYYGALKRLLHKLSRRMQREDNELYPLAARADVSTSPTVPAPRSTDFEQASAAQERARWVSMITWSR
jgi:hemerythrin-like domain-containing protein